MSIPFRIPWFRLVTGATALAAVLALLSAALGDSPSELPDPLPIRREPISRERADEVLADKGVLVKLPLEGFEGLVRRAALAVEAGRNPPRLAEAHYRARLGDTHLENGSAQWKVINPFPTAGVLSLEPCSLALHKPRFENRDALLAAFDGKTLGLLIGPEREHAVSVDWSARGSRRSDGIHFKLEVPPCPLAALELDLPEHQAVVLTSEGCLVSGPHAAESKDRRLWKVGLTNRSEVQFIVRRAGGDAGQAPLVFVRQPHSEQRLTPDAVKADYQLNLEVEPRDQAPLAGQRELRLECDPALRVERVTGRNVLQWEFHDLKKANTPNQLVVWVSEPFQGGTLEIHGQTPLPSGKLWTSPGARLAGAVPRGETLELHLHPDVQLDAWQPGNFRLVNAETRPDGTQVLTLTGGGLGAGGTARRPSAQVQTHGAEMRARQQVWWRVGPNRSSLTAWVFYEVLRGRPFQLGLRLPAGWEVEDVDLSPADLLRNWAVREDKTAALLLVELRRPLTTAAAERVPRLSVQLRPVPTKGGGLPPAADGTGAVTFPIPELVPLNARAREGILAIDVDEQLYQAAVDVQAAAVATVDEEGPWGSQPVDYFFPHFGGLGRGAVRLQPRRARLQARGVSEVVLASGRAALATHLALHAEAGNPKAVDLLLSVPAAGTWTWKARDSRNLVRKAERLWPPDEAARPAVLATRAVLDTAGWLASGGPPALAGLSPRGELWRLTLDQPLDPRQAILVDGTCELIMSGDGRWEVPLPVVLGADRMDGEVKVYLAGSKLVRVETEGLREATAAPGGRPASPWRTFRYGQGPVMLTLRGQAPAADRLADASADGASLTTYAEPGGRLLNQYRFQLSGWRQRTLPLRLPAGARVVAARLDGAAVTHLPPVETAEDGVVVIELPAPAESNTPHEYEIVYILDRPAWSLWARLASPAPGLPVNALAFRRSWCLPPGVEPLEALQLASTNLQASGWTEWEVLAGEDPEAAVLVVRRDLVPWAGLALAAACLLAFWRVQRLSGRRQLGFLLGWLAVAALAVIWLPAPLTGLARWPLLAGCAAALLSYGVALLREARRPATPGSSSGATPQPAALLALLGAAGLLGQGVPVLAQAPEKPTVYTVYVVTGPPDAPEKKTALAPEALWRQLTTLASRSLAAPDGAVLVSAAYEGEVASGTARIKAEFLLHNFSDKATLFLPLDGIRFEEDALLDGARAYLTAAGPPQTGCTLKVEGRGLHRLSLQFRVPVRTAGEDHTLSFTIPKLAQNRLTLHVPRGASYLRVSQSQGRQLVTAGDAGTLRLDADLGPIRASEAAAGTLLELRWLQPDDPPQQPSVEVKEAYLWTLRPDAASLEAVLGYRVLQGSTADLVLNLPEDLEVQSAEARSRPEGGAARLKDWRVAAADSKRQLHVEFQAPVTGEVQIRLQLVPRRPFEPAQATLALPAPAGVKWAGGQVAYRLEGVQARGSRNQNVARLTRPEAFAEAWQAATGVSLPPLTNAFVLLRDQGNPAVRLLDVEPARPRALATLEVSWRIGPQQAQLRATAAVTAPAGDLTLVEWEVPAGVTVTRVSGAEVRHWSRTGSRVQVWLAQSAGTARLSLTGWLNLPAGLLEDDGRQTPAAPPLFELPCVRLLGVEQQTTYLGLTASGLALSPQRVQGLFPLPHLRPSEQDFSFLTVGRDSLYRLTYLCRPAAGKADVQVLTLVEVRDRQLWFSATVHCRPRQGELRQLGVRLRNWDGKEVRLEAERVAGLRTRDERERSGSVFVLRPSAFTRSERTWNLELQPAVTDRYQFTLTGSMPLADAEAGVRLPEISVTEAANVEHWLAVDGQELRAEDAQALEAVKDPARVLPAVWPDAIDSRRHTGLSLWKATGDDWGLRVTPRSPSAAAAPAQVFLSEQSAAVRDGWRWLHEAAYWLYVEAGADLGIVLPGDAAVLAVRVDGKDMAPLQPAPNRLWLPLPGGAGVRHVTFRWVYDAGMESLDRPLLNRPRLEGVADGPAVWTISIPLGYSAAGGTSPAAGAVGLDLRRADVQLRLSSVLAERVRSRGDPFAGPYAAAQRRFFQYWRSAESRLAAGEPAAEAGPQRQSPSDWLQQLAEQNRQLAAMALLRDLQSEAERQARLDPSSSVGSERAVHPLIASSSGPGIIAFWQADAAGAAPRLQLASAARQRAKEAITASMLVLLVLLAVWFLSHLPGVLGVAGLRRPVPGGSSP